MTQDAFSQDRSPRDVAQEAGDSGNAAPGNATLMWRQLGGWAARVRLGRKVAIALIIAAIVSGIATYAALTDSGPAGPNPTTVFVLLNINLFLLLSIGVVVTYRIVQIWLERKRGLAGSRLHLKLVTLFGLVAVIPAIIVAVFSALFLNFGIQSWFDERVRTAVNESREVARAYLQEHQKTIRADALAMAADLNREALSMIGNPRRLNAFVSAQAMVRSLTEAVMFDGSGTILGQSALSFSMQFETVPDAAIQEAQTGAVVLLDTDPDDRVRALVRLDSYADAYLFVGRFVDSKVLDHLEKTDAAVEEYQRLQGRQSSLQITFVMIFVVVALLLLLAAVWVGLNVAAELWRPVRNLIGASERVRAGDLTARVQEEDPSDELGVLSRAFNRMTMQLQEQRRELIDANRQLDTRRRFTETVLSGVSAGVIGLDADGRINLPNRSASLLLGMPLERAIGQRIDEVAPEMAELLEAAQSRPERIHEREILLQGDAGQRTLLVRITAEILVPLREGEKPQGFVVTFDDITQLMNAQRKAAWADVARRIAHEIKNPLTPIQLSAERLKRKYLKQIETDRETFVTCTETIIRHVGDIGRMVDEFSSFARMPSPVLAPANMLELCRETKALYQNAHPDLRVIGAFPAQTVTLICDKSQLRRALTNLAQNAVDSIHGRQEQERQEGRKPKGGVLRIALIRGDGTVELRVEDNGKGLPKEERHRLTEPYVTTREKGTGLGLAIVKKIMEDHDGDLILEDRAHGGACVRLIFPEREAISAPGDLDALQSGHGNRQLTAAHGA
ncbi:sensor histidine kinase NtrY-like [Oceanibaculum pacificum]|uniref:sensor histidine kinase NtrY-like n=1 Tax=Oceanibaculum pacificum TaxID=580166 RepID=UPI000A051199|nr:PAS domain-containing sensor histidine kinase [Oceanibaculum pacificum]